MPNQTFVAQTPTATPISKMPPAATSDEWKS
jgi:hypothetical protein